MKEFMTDKLMSKKEKILYWYRGSNIIDLENKIKKNSLK